MPKALSGPITGISFITGLVAGLAVADHPYPRPGASPADIRRYFQGNARAARVSGAGQLVSAASLARFTSVAAGLAPSRSLRVATTVTGGAAAASLTASALTALALTGPAGRSKSRAVTLHRRLFLAGGPLHTAAFGAFIGCLSLSSRRTGRLPRPLTTAGFGSAAIGMLSPLGLAVEPLILLVPAGRVTGLIIEGLAGARLDQP